MRREVTVRLANGETKLYKVENVGRKFYVRRLSAFGGVDIGEADSFESALNVVRADAGGEVVHTKVQDV